MSTALAEPWGDKPRPDPPHNFDAEQALLGAILVNNLCYTRVAEFLTHEHFANELHGEIFRACALKIEEGRAANPLTLKPYFENVVTDRGFFQTPKEIPLYLARLAASATTIINARDYGEIVLDLWKRRRAISLGEALIEQSYVTDPDLTANGILEAHDQDLTKLLSAGSTGEGPRPFGDFLQSALEKIDQARSSGQEITGVTTGLTGLDALLGGLQPTDLILLAARPSMGKTSLAVNMMTAAARAGTPAGLFSLEMGGAQIAITVLANQVEISSQDQKRGKISSEQFQRLDQSVRATKALPIWLDDTPSLTMPALRARARSLKRRGAGLIIVDYLQLLRMGDRQPSRYEEVTEISRGLKALAKELSVPVVALSQLSRQVESRTDKRPNLADLRESGALEQDADVVMFLYRDEYYLARERPAPHAKAEQKAEWDASMAAVKHIAEIIVAKQRTGPIDTVKVAYDASKSRFSDLADGPDSQESFQL